MRSTFAGLNTMFLGVNSNQLSLHTVGHNITNANTEGYSRQSVNLAAIRAQMETSLYGDLQVGRGVDAQSLTRARDIYADKQYWAGNSTYEYYQARQKQYDKVEAIFNDTTEETIEHSLEAFFKAWQTVSTSSSDTSARIAVIEQGQVLADKLDTTATDLRNQITDNYEDIKLNVGKVNQMLEQMVDLNKGIANAEATGAMANDLRDQRDLLVDNISKYLNVTVYERDNGMYTLVSNGASLVNGIDKLTLDISEPTANATYGINDYSIVIKEANNIEYVPVDGILRAEIDAIAEQKGYIDHMANMAAFLLSSFNAQHQQGIGIDTDSTFGQNFFGDKDTLYQWNSDKGYIEATKYSGGLQGETGFRVDSSGTRLQDDNGYYYVDVKVTGQGTASTPENLTGVQIISALKISNLLTESDEGQKYVAARTFGYRLPAGGTEGVNEVVEANGTGDGSNAVWLATLFNTEQKDVYMTGSVSYIALTSGTSTINTGLVANGTRAIGTLSMNAYYNKAMTVLGSDSEAMDSSVEAQKEIMTQITEWRASTSGVNWNEELTNMIMFQQGYNACSRCLTTMDEMLDRLINNTGVVGR
ncbi:MAG: flagellar hook-associated protein FlgK [Selenomonadaceae bacterium]|nr:flagellar hook-associated protein FlgK [Selenomonadaceae bacterium]